MMRPEYQQLLEKAKSRKTSTKNFFEWLRKNKPADLDNAANNFHESAFEKINCLECANCCKRTGPLLKNRDISNLASCKKTSEAKFTEKYLKVDGDGDWIFKMLPCPFLNQDNNCGVYSSRPAACREFPHTQQRNFLQKLQITSLNALICPAVTVVVESLKTHYRFRA